MHGDVTINTQTKAHDGGAKDGVRAAFAAFQARSNKGGERKRAPEMLMRLGACCKCTSDDVMHPECSTVGVLDMARDRDSYLEPYKSIS